LVVVILTQPLDLDPLHLHPAPTVEAKLLLLAPPLQPLRLTFVEPFPKMILHPSSNSSLVFVVALTLPLVLLWTAQVEDHSGLHRLDTS